MSNQLLFSAEWIRRRLEKMNALYASQCNTKFLARLVGRVKMLNYGRKLIKDYNEILVTIKAHQRCDRIEIVNGRAAFVMINI